MTYIALSVLAVAVATFLPRLLPFLLPKGGVKNVWFNSFLSYIPFAVLAAMVFPAVFYVTDSPLASALGASAAIALSLLKRNLVTVAAGAILVVAVTLKLTGTL